MAFASTTNPVVASMAGGRDTLPADLGYYFGALGVPGTGIVAPASVTAFTETTPLFVVYNPSATVSIYPAYLRLRLSAAGTGASAATYFTNTLDTGNRLTSGGTTLTKANLNMASQNTSVAVCTFGAVTATAATAGRRIVGNSQIRSLATGVIHDTIAVNWGGASQTLTSALINNTTTHSDTVVTWAPVVISPGCSMVLVEWGASAANAKSYEVEFAYVEK